MGKGTKGYGGGGRNKRQMFETRMAEVLGVRPGQVATLFTGARPTSIRVNTLLGEDAAAETRSIVERDLGGVEPFPGADNCYLWTDVQNFDQAVELAHAGRVYLQNASSVLPPVALDPQPGDVVLDVCAAPGGKAFHAAARMGNQGELWLNDAVAPRARKMAELSDTYGVTVHRILNAQAQYLDKELENSSFDRILLDVQCSGEGRVNLAKRDSLSLWSEERIAKYRHLQTKMLDVGYRLLKPGGTMVYSTCTLSPEENELPVSTVLGRRSDLTLVPLSVDRPEVVAGLRHWREHSFDQRLVHAVRMVPSPLFEGFFVAVLRKSS